MFSNSLRDTAVEMPACSVLLQTPQVSPLRVEWTGSQSSSNESDEPLAGVWSEPGCIPAGLCLRTAVSEGQRCPGGRSSWLVTDLCTSGFFLSFIHLCVSSGTPLVPGLKNKSIKLVSSSLQTVKWLLKTRPRRARGGLKVLVLGSGNAGRHDSLTP